MSQNRMKMLKFIVSIFNMSLNEIKDTLGFEALTMIMRRVGENVGENIASRFKGKFNTPDEFLNLVVKQVFEPVIGEGAARASVDGNKVRIELDACPYKKAGMKIIEMDFFCHYTEGLVDAALQSAFPSKTFFMDEPSELISKEGCDHCVFHVDMS